MTLPSFFRSAALLTTLIVAVPLLTRLPSLAEEPDTINLGGEILGDLSSAMAGGKVYVVGRGTDNRIWFNKISSAGVAEGWTPVPGSPLIKLSPSCAGFGGGVRCAAVTENGSTIISDLKGGVTNLQGKTKSSPAAVSKSSGAWMGVFVRSIKNTFVVNGFVAEKGWQGWTETGLQAFEPASCVYMADAYVDCYLRSGDSSIVQYADVLRKGPVGQLGGKTDKKPHVWRGKNSVRLMVRGTDGLLWQKFWDQSEGWRDWKPTSLKISSAPNCRPGFKNKEFWCFDNPGNTVVIHKVIFGSDATSPEELEQ